MPKEQNPKAKSYDLRWVHMTGGKKVKLMPTHHAKPLEDSEKYRHSRPIRAKCRLLATRGVSPHTLLREFGGAYSTMTKILRKHYSKPDDVENDLAIALVDDPAFQRRLDDILEHGVELDNPQPNQLANHHGEEKGVAPLKQEPDVPAERDDPIIMRSESPPPRLVQPAMVPVGAPHAPLPAGADADAGAPATVPAPEPKDALHRFLIRIGCKALYGPLKEIGVDQAKLYRMSNYDEERLDRFMVKLGVLVPEMTPFMRLMLSDEIRGLAPIVVE